jgi:hypothetical protein
MSDDNPYTPPASLEDPATNDPAFWYTAGRALYVRNGAALPPVELETGQTGRDLAPEVQQSHEERWTTWNLITIGLGSFILARVIRVYEWPLFPFSLLVPVIVILTLRLIFFRFTPARHATISFTLYRSPSTTEKRRRSARARNFYKVILAITGFAPWLATHPDTHTAAIILLFVGLITWRVARRLRNREPLLFRAPESHDANGWLRIGNVHPIAMKKLVAIENKNQPAEEDGPQPEESTRPKPEAENNGNGDR